MAQGANQMRVEPKDFLDHGPDIKAINGCRAQVEYFHTVWKVGVESPCRIDGAIVSKVSGHDPEPDLWFLVRCENVHRSLFYLVTDGEKWLFYDRKRKYLTNTTKISNTVNLSKLNQIDRTILRIAIANYILDDGIDVDSNAGASPGQAASSKARRIVRV